MLIQFREVGLGRVVGVGNFCKITTVKGIKDCCGLLTFGRKISEQGDDVACDVRTVYRDAVEYVLVGEKVEVGMYKLYLSGHGEGRYRLIYFMVCFIILCILVLFHVIS